MPPSLPNTSEFLPGPVLLLGAPGVGKGTQAKRMVEEFGVPQISTGDILRAIKNDPAKANTPMGHQAKGLMDLGQLVPDDLVNELVKDRLAEPDTARGYILDGFPRTLNQAEWLDNQLAGSALPVVAVHIVVPERVLLERITGRLSCPVCGTIYNTFSKPPRTPGICDLDGNALVQREDDTEEVFHQRMKAFQEQTSPVIDYYRTHGNRFAEVDGNLHVDEVVRQIQSTLFKLRHHEGSE